MVAYGVAGVFLIPLLLFASHTTGVLMDGWKQKDGNVEWRYLYIYPPAILCFLVSLTGHPSTFLSIFGLTWVGTGGWNVTTKERS
jgi:hypothetical protein